MEQKLIVHAMPESTRFRVIRYRDLILKRLYPYAMSG